MTTNRKQRVRKLEAALTTGKVHWRLKNATEVEADPWDILDCFISVMKKEYHPLLEKIREADLSTYTGRDSFMGLINALCNSRERYYDRH